MYIVLFQILFIYSFIHGYAIIWNSHEEVFSLTLNNRTKAFPMLFGCHIFTPYSIKTLRLQLYNSLHKLICSLFATRSIFSSFQKVARNREKSKRAPFLGSTNAIVDVIKHFLVM